MNSKLLRALLLGLSGCTTMSFSESLIPADNDGALAEAEAGPLVEDTAAPADANANANANADADADASIDTALSPPIDATAATDAAVDSSFGAAAGPDASTAASADGEVPIDAAVATSTTEYAPYFYAWGWGNAAYPFTSLVDLQKKAGVNGATLAFALARSGTCEVSRTIPNHLADIKAFRAAGGRVKVSFGGASGTYLDAVCGSSTALAAAIGAFVDETDLRDLDFDIEQSGVMTSAINARRGAALASVQASRGVKVSFTLAVDPTGLTDAAYAVLKSALAAGVEVSRVNLMTMDYGSTISAGKTMGGLAIAAIESTVKQLKAAIPGLSDARAFAMIGATPMIGQNDVKTEVFTLGDAKTLAAYAREKRLGLVSFWAIQRDQPCGATVALDTCSVAGAPPYGFHGILRGVAAP